MLKIIQDRIVDYFYFARRVTPTYDKTKTFVLCNPISICLKGKNQYLLMCFTSNKVSHRLIINQLKDLFDDMTDTVEIDERFHGMIIALHEEK